MSGGAKKAVPREKTVRFQEGQFRVEQVSFINGALQPVGAVVFLPVGVDPSKNLTPVDEDGNTIKKAAKKAAFQIDDAFLARNVPEVVGDLEGRSSDELAAYLKAEKGGKARTGVLDALEAAHAAAVEAEKTGEF